MSNWIEIPLTLIGAVALWAAGTVAFDTVHWILHCLLQSQSRILRAVAWPHSVHHEWLDRTLTTRWENQWRNVWCHLVPEYLTQVAFSGFTTLFLPARVVLVCIALQTVVFIALLSYKGLDINHRAIRILDAYRPSAFAPPAYHALHHVYPGAYFSAYSKLVDWIVGGGAQLRDRRFALLGGTNPFGRALRQALEREGVASIVEIETTADSELEGVDALVLCDTSVVEAPLVEAFIEKTRTRQLPPEVWAVHQAAENAVARHYYRDLRVLYRTIVLPGASSLDERHARRTAKIALFFIRRGFNYVPAALSLTKIGRAHV